MRPRKGQLCERGELPFAAPIHVLYTEHSEIDAREEKLLEWGEKVWMESGQGPLMIKKENTKWRWEKKEKMKVTRGRSRAGGRRVGDGKGGDGNNAEKT